MTPLLIVFVHGYSVTNLDTYGELPLRLHSEAIAKGYEAKIENLFLGRYISFNDEVRLNDVSRAMQMAVEEQIPAGTRFICITHSTGGPVVRNWWNFFYQNQSATCPMSHLVMLAPANHGSALAQLGKTRLSRVKSWFDGVEPGQKILDWLELGSTEAWQLNTNWITNGNQHISEKGIFPFVITGQDIDRKLYDHINSYTGELGSDGVVRVASANLNNAHIKLKQEVPQFIKGKLSANTLEISEFNQAPITAMRVLTKKSHSGDDMGIMRSVKKEITNDNAEIIKTIFDCISVNNKQSYLNCCNQFLQETKNVQENSLVEVGKKVLKNTLFFHDRYSMIIFRIKDNEGHALTNFDLLLTGPKNDPNNLPSGFFADRQFNKVNQCTISYFFNYDVIMGAPAVMQNGEEVRKELPGISSLGIIIKPRPDEGFIRYLPCQLNATKELLEKALRPNATTLIEIELQRLVNTEIFRFEKPHENKVTSASFKNTKPGTSILPE
ncbi:esterase/lipase family protein [Aurantibacillus circumpalustris]|uniref:esterase/lipase family protein n=1 Tax=Aurantibacillus circumpalustris TaxID=3036359 RepID=UPI00295AD05D|nr:hypothetical protein [Aurantibacillus circumpalustris]